LTQRNATTIAGGGARYRGRVIAQTAMKSHG